MGSGPPKYVMLNEQGGGDMRPPPPRRPVPRYGSHKRSSGAKCCLKCICCCYCFLFIMILVLFGTIIFFFTYIKPEKPSYDVSKVDVKAFDVLKDLSLYAELSVSVKADNPNNHIEFNYGKDSSVDILYKGSNTLCSGKLPAFDQPTNNITIMNVQLKGKHEFGSGIQDSLLQDQKKGKIPLLITVKAPVSVVVIGLRLHEVMVSINASLVLDNISPNKKVNILSSQYSYDVEV